MAKKKKEENDIVPVKNGAMPVPVVASSEIEDAIRDKHKEISFTDTPKYYVKEKQGFDYVDEGYMRHVLNQFYPAWNWEIIKYELLGSEWVAVQGRLTIHDNGINRKYDSISSHRIQKKRGSDEFVDIGNDMKAANSDAFKVAVNRLCNVSDDVYRKRIESAELSEKQVSFIKDLAVQLDMVDKIDESISNGRIHKFNASHTITQLKEMVNRNNKGE